MKKRVMCRAGAVALVLLLLTSGVFAQSDTQKGAGEVAETSLLTDRFFTQGFRVRGLNSIKDGTTTVTKFDYGNPALNPIWVLAQWGSLYSFADPAYTVFTRPSASIARYDNPTKTFQVDLDKHEVLLQVTASAMYEKPRAFGEDWPHLLLEQKLSESFRPAEQNALSNMASLRVRFGANLVQFEDRMGEQADPSLHCAQIQVFLMMTNLNSKSRGYKDYLWFGVPIFDNRYPSPPGYAAQDGGKEDATQKFIYTIDDHAVGGVGKAFWREGKPYAADDAPWVEFNVEILAHMKKALAVAQERGFMKTSEWDDLYVSGFNLGWEVPGTYDVAMKIRSLDIISATATE